MDSIKQESHFFDPKKRTKTKSCKKMKALLKTVGGRKGLLLASVILTPKF